MGQCFLSMAECAWTSCLAAGSCDSIILNHEGDCPGWLVNEVDEAIELRKEVEAV
jgi:hypothetical protein